MVSGTEIGYPVSPLHKTRYYFNDHISGISFQEAESQRVATSIIFHPMVWIILYLLLSILSASLIQAVKQVSELCKATIFFSIYNDMRLYGNSLSAVFIAECSLNLKAKG